MRKKWGNIVFSPNFSSENRGGHAIIRHQEEKNQKIPRGPSYNVKPH